MVAVAQTARAATSLGAVRGREAHLQVPASRTLSLAAAHPAPRRPVLRTLAALRSFLRRAEQFSTAVRPPRHGRCPVVDRSHQAYLTALASVVRSPQERVTQSHGPNPSGSRAASPAA